MYENYPKICITTFCICILAYCFSPREDMSIRIENVSAKEVQTASGKTASGISLEIPTWGKEDKPTKKLVVTVSWRVSDAECKISELSKKGIRDEIARSLVINCKELATDPRHCIIVGASIVKAESGGGNKCNWYNCFWIWGGGKKYKSYNEWVKDFVIRYTKYWYKAKSASFFYPSKWSVSPSRYCTSETSSNSSKGCPNWQKHAQDMWNKLNKLF